MNTEFYKLSGIFAFVIMWTVMLLAIFSQGKDKSKSISMHIADSKKTIAMLAVFAPIAMTLLMIFAVKWVAPLLGLSTTFIVLNVLADACFILAAWVPSTKGRKAKLHDLFSYGASLLLIPITLLLAMSPNASTVSRAISSVTLVAMLGILGTMLRHKRILSSYLHYQILYFLAFDISLLAAGYIR
jgi:hypothetical protein